MISNYIGIDRIIEKINRFKIPGGTWNVEELVEWTYDALDAINDKNSRVTAFKDVEVLNNTVKIPIEVEVLDYVYVLRDGEINSRLEEVLPHRPLTPTTYIVNSGCIYTDFTDPKVILRLEYKSIPLDEEGLPLIPDNRLYISAIEAFLQYMIGKRSFYQGKILERQYKDLEQEWYFHLPAAQASTKMNILKDPKRFARIHNKFIH